MSAVLALFIALMLFAPDSARTRGTGDCLETSQTASPVATPEICDHQALIASIDAELNTNASERYEIAPGAPLIESRYLPVGQFDGVTWRVQVSTGGGAHWLSLLWYETEMDANEAKQAFEAALAAEFFVPAPVADFEAPDACFGLVREESARGVCLLVRDNLLIVGYSFLEVDHIEGQISVASDLVQLLEEVLPLPD